MTAVIDRIIKRIRAKGRGWVFTPKDFLDMGTRAAVDQVLSRLARQGIIRRLDRGFYDYPKQHPVLGSLSPDIDSLAKALTAQSGDKLFPSGALAANLLGLSMQVPAKPVYLTNGASRTKQIGHWTITLKHARVPLLDRLSDKVNAAFQALSYLGKSNIDEVVISHCASLLDERDIRTMTTVVAQLPGWMADVIFKIQQVKDGQIRNPL
jgi:hypothetical protein